MPVIAPTPSLHPSQIGCTRGEVLLRRDGGRAMPLDLARWNRPASAEEQEVLASVEGPALDLGCGPGRLVLHLAAQRIMALGIDASSEAVALARRRRAAVLQRDLFGPLPGEGRWASALLFDGNVGIGGDPVRLLDRCRALICPSGRVVVEVGPPATGWRPLSAQLEHGGRRSASFAWAVVGADAVGELARLARLTVDRMTVTPSGRRFALLERAGH